MSSFDTGVRTARIPFPPLAVPLIAVLLAGCAPTADADARAAESPGPTVTAAPAVTADSLAQPPPAPVSYPARGDNTWDIAHGEPASGRRGAGQLLRYQVAMERGIQGIPLAEFADQVTDALAHPQGWTAGGRWQLRRVGPGRQPDFTVYLATPVTRDVLCQDTPDGYTSCRNGDRVVLNVARWVKGTPGFGKNIDGYRQYVVNHEVGHRLGMGHELCPGRGRPAPVMQQQTLGLHGCTANGLPYLDGRRYSGPSGAYNDRIPPRDRGMRSG
ncbi:DUF3152 domain-containing protein [Micromonospora sp. NPDC002389]|uniref:DUF3152 domain-containing protein n=1 Tax=Micromonospora sp. NPDC002389 TaxID=3154272 RepID=UPI0033322F8B